MDIEYPSYYEMFHCIASRCKDSCCRGWCIDVDEESRNQFLHLKGRIGDKVQSKLREEEGNFYFPLEKNGDCPFLLPNGLCEIIVSAGEGALCTVCASYPRIKQIYGNYAIYDLNASCEEAFRHILAWDGEILRGTEEERGEDLSPEQERALIQLIAFRNALFDELPFLPTDFNGFFKELYHFFQEGEVTIFPESGYAQKSSYSLGDRLIKWKMEESYDFLDKKRYSSFLAWQNEIEEKNKDFSLWRALFHKQDHFPCSTFIHLSLGKKEEWKKTLPALFRYYFFRYSLLSLKEESLLPVFSLIYHSIEWIYTAYLMIENASKEERDKFSCFFSEEPNLLRIVVFFSKEIEHDENNLKKLLFYRPDSIFKRKEYNDTV